MARLGAGAAVRLGRGATPEVAVELARPGGGEASVADGAKVGISISGVEIGAVGGGRRRVITGVSVGAGTGARRTGVGASLVPIPTKVAFGVLGPGGGLGGVPTTRSSMPAR